MTNQQLKFDSSHCGFSFTVLLHSGGGIRGRTSRPESVGIHTRRPLSEHFESKMIFLFLKKKELKMFSCWFLFGEPFVRCQTKEGKLTKLAVPCCCVFPSILFVANHLFSILFRISLLALCLLCSLENAFESFTSDQLRRIILQKKIQRTPSALITDGWGRKRPPTHLHIWLC